MTNLFLTPDQRLVRLITQKTTMERVKTSPNHSIASSNLQRPCPGTRQGCENLKAHSVQLASNIVHQTEAIPTLHDAFEIRKLCRNYTWDITEQDMVQVSSRMFQNINKMAGPKQIKWRTGNKKRICSAIRIETIRAQGSYLI